MLTHLDIQNIAVIEKLNIDFDNGMSVLTGETGAGKSIIIDSINMILGGRTNKGLVRYGEKKAQIQAIFQVGDKLDAYLNELGILAEDGQIIISREITDDGRSVCRVNSIITPIAVLKELAQYLINIHGQHDNQALLTPSKHINFLDSFARNSELLENYKLIYIKRKSLADRIKSLDINEKERMQRIDLLKYQVEEIEEATLLIGEDAELEKERDIISHAEKISIAVKGAYIALYESDIGQAAYDNVSLAVNSLEDIISYDDNIKGIYDRLCDIMYSMEDCVHELSDYGNRVEFDENRLNDIEERLDIISKLKRKYGSSIEEILNYGCEIKKELETLSDYDEEIMLLQNQFDELSKQLMTIAKNISDSRILSAKALQEKICSAFTELDMPSAKFFVEVKSGEELLSNGIDNVEFLISANAGEPLKPLAKVASGGELSRVMLAMKSILADSDDVDTLIFDEIDTGVSGSAAQKIATKLSQIAKNKQVICITHLATLAAMSDYHYLIEKNVKNEKTYTSLVRLDEQERKTELARMIDGENIMDTALKHATQMLKNADYIKNSRG